jgi:uncharacterized protein (TIGR02001 family)
MTTRLNHRNKTTQGAIRGSLINKTTLIAGFILQVGMAGVAQAAEFSGNVAYTNDYRFRGISQTDEDMAVQGGFDIDFGNGFYAGTWASNVQFGGSIEIDWYGGYAGEVNDDLSYDIGYMYYSYPSDAPTLTTMRFTAASAIWAARWGWFTRQTISRKPMHSSICVATTALQ